MLARKYGRCFTLILLAVGALAQAGAGPAQSQRLETTWVPVADQDPLNQIALGCLSPATTQALEDGRFDPDAKLYYNDGGEGVEGRTAEGLGPMSDGVFNLVKGLLDQGAPIHAVGLQIHFDVAATG